MAEAEQLLARDGFDLVLMDWLQLPDLEHFDGGLFPAHPALLVVLMTMDNDLSQAKRALHWGVHGVVTEHDAAEELLPALYAVFAGQRYLSRELVSGLSAEERASLLAIPEEESE